MARGNRRAPPHAAPARRRDLRVVQPRRPLPAHHHRARCDGLARGYRPSRCHAREGGCDERRLLARRPPGRDARCEGKHARRFASSTPEPAGCCTCWRRKSRVSGSSSRASRSRRTTAFWRRRASGARTSGTPAAAGSSAAPLRQARRGDRSGLQPGRQPARRRGTRRRRSDLGRGEGRSSLLLSGFTTDPVLAVAWSPDGVFLADASADRTVHVLSANGPLGGRLVGNLVGHGSAVRAVAWSPERTLAAQRRAPTARRGSGTPSSTRSCAPWEAPPRRRAGGVVRPGRAPHRLGRHRRHRPDLERSRPAPAARSLAQGGRSKMPSSAPTAAWS